MAFFILILLFVVCIGLCFIDQCPHCQEYRAFKKTGQSRQLKQAVYELEYFYRCKRCGYSEWRKIGPSNHSNEGGGGC
ncbi:hypothetical protein BJL95_06945 [Methylomonas sp. LWB]|nr:hypothetical protein BJL95_06945 [Methylomonas sp. LWB]